jgi:PAS domain S-box-containing protein
MPEGSARQATHEDELIRYLLEGTSAHLGADFFAALVKCLATALDVACAWVTEPSPDRKRLRALAFWYKDRYIDGFDYPIEGTPCEPVIENCSLFHVPENVIELYPHDAELVPLSAVSYAGLPLVNAQGTIIGHVAILDTKPLPLTSRVEAILHIFGARAGAEIQRLRSEQRLQDREKQLSSLLDSTWEAILVIDEEGNLCHANRCCQDKFGADGSQLEGTAFAGFLTANSAQCWLDHWEAAIQTSDHRLWFGDLEVSPRRGATFPAEASLASFEHDGRRYWTVILRDLREQREAERRLCALAAESSYLRDVLEDVRPVGRLTGESAAMKALFNEIRRVAPTDATVLIQGESGTGKELVAQAIHDASRRAGKPMVRVNCGAIPAALMESEFFGHARGSFTGATDRREGRFAVADGGTLFLDEVGELPLDLQVKLLRVLQEGEFEPIGTSVTRKVDVRIIAATNRNLAAEVEHGRFRADFYYRLNVFPISVAPLRERSEDIELLADLLVARFAQKMGRRLRPLSRSMRARLAAYHWPGNVRELENVLERAAILARGDEVILDERVLPGVAHPTRPSAVPAAQVLTVGQLQDLERENMLRALELCSWRVAGDSGAARLLGMAPSTLTSRMKALGIARTREKSPNSLA